MTAQGLIDTTEMYLRTIFELEEEGIVPLRARIAERLRQSGPTVSQTVARMERDGLVRVENDRHLVMTEEGRRLATQVMRKHRLAERLLVDIIGLPWEDVHVEACRWEHVISEAVEERLIGLLKEPWTCAHGNPIPGLDELGVEGYEPEPFASSSIVPIPEALSDTPTRVTIRRISEQIQSDTKTMLALKRTGVQPGKEVTLEASDDGVRVIGGNGEDGESIELPRQVASLIFVTRV
ncbi:metal-dependent transcriptional regulator [Thermobifida fusca]|uniref:Iron dependent repressor n=1 Tax=Thermobifida fusca TM51 TaxID=1169414 RepID=A0A9P2WSE6_THEFU|nr:MULTISPECIES: metal-dependent transcriptional regulator [Thermobifida]EOR72633.1 iron dependent repressor [Thermobifida fusca TM51]MBO2529845.1 dihydrofolate reductase [Thermobifida sp.]MDD6790613.1 iron dependent repressor, metal binding and dimerization domain protein [Thermobifida fusca]PPS94041.1 dihydrofolate reductase [Thermobifida fusca]PZN64577.1 MAG: dihydrofolate reductase [Thermobifida fusca]